MKKIREENEVEKSKALQARLKLEEAE